jgi:hypothetical protein
MRCSRRACTVRGMSRETETSPVGDGVLFPYAILVVEQFVLFSVEVPFRFMVVLFEPVS